MNRGWRFAVNSDLKLSNRGSSRVHAPRTPGWIEWLNIPFPLFTNISWSSRAVSLRSPDVFPVVASLPPKGTTGNTSALRRLTCRCGRIEVKVLTSQTHTYISSVECDTRLKSLALGPLAALAPDKNFLRDKRWRFVYTGRNDRFTYL